ncbi:MAG: hypothetical protein ACM3US_07260 [Sphingomonadaceae bacterium]
MARRKMSTYQLFATSFLRARSRPGMSKEQLQELMKEAGRAWQRARRGHNPFPELNLHIDMVEGSHDFSAAGEDEVERASCPHCGELLEIPAQAAGQIGRCGACGGEFEVVG